MWLYELYFWFYYTKQDAARAASSSAENIIFYSSKSFKDNAIQSITNSLNNITGIEIPNDLNGQQLQIRVALRVLGRLVSNESTPAIVGKCCTNRQTLHNHIICSKLIPWQIMAILKKHIPPFPLLAITHKGNTIMNWTPASAIIGTTIPIILAQFMYLCTCTPYNVFIILFIIHNMISSYIGVSPIYLASFETINVTGSLTTLRLRFQLACGLGDDVMCSVNITARNTNNISTFSQTHENISNLFYPTEVFLNFSNIMMGLEYVIHARLLDSEGEPIGPEHQRIINVSLRKFILVQLVNTVWTVYRDLSQRHICSCVWVLYNYIFVSNW